MKTAAFLAALTGSSHLAYASRYGIKYPDCKNGPQILTSNLVCDPHASAGDRAAAIINAMTIEEKLENLVDIANGSARLGLPKYEWWSEALHGLARSNYTAAGDYSYATSFPMPITFSAAFDDELVLDIATVISTEARAFSNAGRAGLNFFTPNINAFKDPRWGRGAETPGEDPLRIQGFVKQLLIGLEDSNGESFEGSGKFKKMLATCKHFTGYDLELWSGSERFGYDAFITTQDMAEYYMPPFQTCARDQNVASIMCSYNAVNGVPTCASAYLQETILRVHWGWKKDNNFIVSDCNAIGNIAFNHNYTKSSAAAAGIALINGMDNACVLQNTIPTDMVGAYQRGYVTEEVITKALIRQYEGLIVAGYFDPADANPYRSIGWDEVNTPASQALARKAANAGSVLLKNDGTLPYKFPKNATVAVIGNWANATIQMQGQYFGRPPFYHGPLVAAEQLGLNAIYADGPKNQSVLTANFSGPALDAAKQADIVLYFGGIDSSIEAESLDRYQISWPAAQLELLRQITALKKKTIVVQLGSMLDATPLLNDTGISALIWAGYGGQAGGDAAFDIITGAVAPAGRLPVTMYPASYVDQVPMTNMSLRPGPGNPGRTYRWYDKAVLPYAYGLHYTKFHASFSKSDNSSGSGNVKGASLQDGGRYNIQDLLDGCDAQHKDLCPLPSVSVSVTNQGKVKSDFVAVVFSKTRAGPAPYPLKTLVTYGRLHDIAAGQTATASLNLNFGALARRDELGDQILFPGTYQLLVDVPTQETISIELTGQLAVLDNWPQPPPKETYKNIEDCPLNGPCAKLGQPFQ